MSSFKAKEFLDIYATRRTVRVHVQKQAACCEPDEPIPQLSFIIPYDSFQYSFSSICAYILEVECSFRNPYQILSAILIVSMFASLTTDVIVLSLILFIRNTQTD
jgi:hypothetical protein